MRIIAGAARGRKLQGPRTMDTRPMTDRAREGLFSSLAAVIPGADVLDLYAGSGSLGLEALSRGAASATFVEHGAEARRALQANIERVGLGGTMVASTVEAFLRSDTGQYDLAFVDPPYAHSVASVAEVTRDLAPRLRPGGIVILHRRAGEARPEIPGLRPEWERTYGTTQLWRYVKESE